MGSFHLACMVSTFPITPGDKVKVIFLKEQHGNSDTYPDAYWRPIGIPLSGEYDDYGRIDINGSSEYAKNLLVEQISKNHIPVGPGSNTSHDIPVPKIETYEDIIDSEWQARLFIKSPFGIYKIDDDPIFSARSQSSLVRKVVIREDIWDEMLKYTTEGFINKQMLDVKYFFETYFKTHKEIQIQRLVDPDNKSWAWSNKPMLIQTCEDHLPVEQKRIISKMVNSDSKHVGDPKLLSAMKTMAEFAIVNLFMTDNRMTWHPTTSVGSQEQEFLNRAKFNTAIAQVAIKYEIEQDIEWGNYGDKSTAELKEALKKLEEAKLILDNLKPEE